MGAITSLIYWALNLFLLSLIGRLILDYIRIFSPNWRPTGVVLAIAELIYTITDKPLAFVRQFVPPLRLGGVALDLPTHTAVSVHGVGATVVWIEGVVVPDAVRLDKLIVVRVRGCFCFRMEGVCPVLCADTINVAERVRAHPDGSGERSPGDRLS